jgi:transcriptional regulator with XRE-family HTH domain
MRPVAVPASFSRKRCRESITSEVMEGRPAAALSSRMTSVHTFGDHLREWRQRRRMSQLDLACEAEISTRHLSFIETGRSSPSREMVLRLAERLDVPLRERNVLLVAAGYAPAFAERSLDDPALRNARKAIDLVLAGHEPYPALAIDRHWTMQAANKAVAPLIAGVEPSLLQPPVNVLRLSLHPQGLAPRIANLKQWREHLIERLRRQIDISGDPALVKLMSELRSYPIRETVRAMKPMTDVGDGAVIVPFQLVTDAGILSFFSTTTLFGMPLDITLSELALESFFPADPATAQMLGRCLQQGT